MQPPATAAESVAPIDVPVDATTPVIAQPLEPNGDAPEAEGPQLPGSITPVQIATPPTPTTPTQPTVIPVAPAETNTEQKSTAIVDRSKTRRRKVADPTGETSGTSASSPTAPATTEPTTPTSRPAASDPTPRLPGDLKDPFPSK
jgi:hypothetical protein